jgi:adenine C2-methylase RlmN of 23S rRNA A2503 and tRNA A37
MIVKSLKAKINFIPFNPCLPAGRAIKDVVSSTQDNLREPSSLEIGTFLSCMDKKLFYSLRKSKGRDIHAACGNLSLQLTQEINNL